jgi:hypothetical protein
MIVEVPIALADDRSIGEVGERPRDVQVGRREPWSALLQVRGTYSARRSREAAMSCSVSSGRSRVLRERRHRAREQRIDFSAASDEFPKWAESLCI